MPSLQEKEFKLSEQRLIPDWIHDEMIRSLKPGAFENHLRTLYPELFDDKEP